MRITLFALLALGLSTAPAFAGARIHRLYHAPIQPQRAVLQQPHAMFHESAVAPLPGKTIPMLPTSRPLPPPQAPTAIAESDIPAEPIVSDVSTARTLPIIPVTARTSEASPSVQPVLSRPRARYSGRVVAPASSTVVVPVASQLAVGTVRYPSPVSSPAPAPEPQTLKVTKPSPLPIVAPVAAPKPAPQPVVTPAVVSHPAPQPAVAPAVVSRPAPKPAVAPVVVSHPAPKPAVAPAVVSHPAPQPAVAPAVVSHPAPKPAVAPAVVSHPAPKPAVTPAVIPHPAPKPAAAPTATPKPTPTPAPTRPIRRLPIAPVA